MKRITGFWLVMILLMGGLIGFMNLSGDAENGNGDTGIRYASQSKSGLTSHDPIYINGNSQFTPTYGVTGGSGTKSDPYVIEGWDINASSTNGIYIENTDAYFVIRNCVIHDGGTTYNGIRFSSVTNGKINNITSYNNYCGVILCCSSNNKITSNQIYNNYYGVHLYYSSNNNTISNCNVYNNTYYEIFLEAYFDSGCDYNQITNCAVHNKGHGIYLESSNNNQISNCVVYNTSGIELFSSSNNKITNCDIYNNFNGISLKYSLYMGSSSDNQISKCKIYSNSNNGIYLDSSSNTITNCAVYNNDKYGIWLYSSSNNNITNCNVYNNYNGVYLGYSSNNEIHYNNIYGNTDYGIYNCDSQPKYRVYATDNWWGSASGSYHPDTNPNGTGNNVTDNVLYNPWLTESWEAANHVPVVNSIIANPTTVNTGGTVTITVSATDEDNDALTYHYTCSGGTISGTGNTVTWVAPNTVGSYTVSIYVNDGTVNSNSKSVTVTVTDGDGGAITDGGDTTNGDEEGGGEKEKGKGFIPSFEMSSIIIVLAGCAGVGVIRKKKIKKGGIFN